MIFPGQHHLNPKSGRTLILQRTLIHARTYTHPHTCTYSPTHQHIPTHTRAHSHTHTCTYPHTHAHTQKIFVVDTISREKKTSNLDRKFLFEKNKYEGKLNTHVLDPNVGIKGGAVPIKFRRNVEKNKRQTFVTNGNRNPIKVFSKEASVSKLDEN